MSQSWSLCINCGHRKDEHVESPTKNVKCFGYKYYANGFIDECKCKEFKETSAYSSGG